MKKRFSSAILTVLSIFFFQISFINLNAKLDFANQSSSIVLKNNDSRFKVSSSNYINGWKEQSIVLKSGNDNSWISDNIIYGYEVGDSNPPSHLIFNDSNAIVTLDNLTGELIVENSNAIVNINEDVIENSSAIITNASNINYNSQAIVTNKNDIDTNINNINYNSQTIVTNKTDIDSNDNDINYNSQAIVTNRSDIDSNDTDIAALQADVAENSSAIVVNRNDIDTNTNNILYNSNAIVTIDNLTGELIVENSNAIVNINEDVIENSSAIITNASNINYNSQAIVTNKNDIDTNINNINYNSQTIVTNRTDIDSNDNDINYNSQAIVTNRSDIDSNDTDIAALQADVAENSSAIVVNRNDIDTNTNNILYNSNAIVTLENLTGDLIVENSNAIVNIAEDVIENSQAIVTNRSDIDSNDTDIAALQADVAENSSAIVVNRNDIDTNTNNILYNSNAIVTLENLTGDLIIENSNAIVNIAEDVIENSQAIVTNRSDIDSNDTDIAALQADVAENSSAIVVNRNDIDTNTNNILYNSNAIVTLENLTGDLIVENSNAIVNINEDVIENSNAIVTLENITGDLTTQNSNAIANHFEHFISLNNGKLYAVGSISGETIIDGKAILSSPINLNGATLSNGGDILFSSQTTIESSGYLSPQSNAYILGGDLSLPENTTLTFTSNGIIDGQGHILNFGNNTQILIDSNITVTFRNLTLQNSTNDQTIPPIKCLDWYSKLVLENVKFALNDDFIFKTGQMYFHDDVVFTGSSKFSYQSTLPSYITSQASLHFDNETTFEYYPSCTRDDLIVLCDETSDIFLNGCTLQTTHTGIKLAKGRLFLDNKTTLSSATNTILDSLTLISSENIGEYVHAIDWSPDQHYISIGTENPNSGQELQLYSFYNDTLTSYTSKQYGVDSPAIYTTKFSPDGQYLAIGGHTNNPRGDEEFQIYSFYNDTLSTYTIQSKDTAWWVAEVAWSPSGDNISLANYWPITAHEDIELYGFQNAVLTTYTNRDFGSRVYSTDWRPDEKYIAFGGKIPTDTAELHIYSFDNSTMSDAPAFIRDYGSSSSYLLTTKWSPDGQYFAIGGHKPHSGNELQIYSLINDTLSTYTSKNYGTEIQSISWSPDGQYLAMGGRNAGDELQIYSFKSGQLSSSPLISQSWGYEIYSVEWSPDGNYLAVGGNQPDSGNELEIYKVNYRFDTTSQTLSNAIRFGDSEKGSNYDLDVNILSGAQVILNGVSWFDNSITSSRKLDFANMCSSFVLSDTNSRFKITNSEDISGWKEQSIIATSGNNSSWLSDDTIYGYNITETAPPSHLLYNDSNAIVNINENVIENSNTIVNIESDLAIQNSNAIINLEENISENSGAIVTNANNINYNSQAIVTIDNEMEIVKLIAQNSAAIIGNSNSIVTLDRKVTENSNAIVNNSWAIADLNNQIAENSWAIQNLIEHGEAIELVAQNSNAIFSASQSIVTLDREITENSNAILNNQSAINNNSQAIVQLNDYIIENSNFIEDNSWAILALTDDVNENSMAIVTNKTDIDSNDDNINYNSQAIVTNRSDIDTNTNNIFYNSNAIVNIESDLAIQNSNAIINLEEDITENSNAIVNIESGLAIQNSNAIINLQEDIHENSQAIIFIRETGTNLIVENSNAIVNNSSFIAQELIIQNSDAIVSITNFPLVDEPLTTDITLEKSAFIHPTQRIFVAGNITINGQGATLYFATDERPIDAQFVIDEYKTLILKNIRLVGLTQTTFEFRKGSRLIIGENVSWEFHRNITLSSGNIILQNQTSADGSDIANSFYIRGIGGKKRLTLTPDSDTTLPMINLGQNTLALQNIEFTGLEYISQSISPDGLLIGALGLAGDTAVNIEQSNNMAFAIMGLGNTFRMLENNVTFNGQLDFVGLGEDVLHLDFVLRSPVESVNAGTQLADGKVPVINFGTGFIYLTSLSGVARIIFDDYLIRINNAANAFIATNNGYLGANKLYVSGDPIWDASNDSSKNRFAVEANEIEAVKALGKEYKKQLPDFGIPIIVDPYHPHRTSDFRSIDDDTDLIKTLKENIRPKTALQLERAKEENIDPSTLYFGEPNFIIKN